MSTDSTSHRVAEFRWLPKTVAEWRSFTLARVESANLWNALVVHHAGIRKGNEDRIKNNLKPEKWPSYRDLEQWAHGNYPMLGSQSVQQTVKDFCDCVSATTAARKVQREAGFEVTAKYPWKTPKYRQVIYTNQMATIKDGILRLSHGRGGNAGLRIKLPSEWPLPGRFVEIQLEYGVIRFVCQVDEPVIVPEDKPIGVDLGVNTLVAASDGNKSLLISGREAKSLIRYRNKTLAKFQSRVDRTKSGSRRRKKLQRAKWDMLHKSERKLKDLHHKATRLVANEFPNAKVFVGKPFNEAAKKLGKCQAQQVSGASNAKLIFMLGYKLSSATEVDEHYSSQTCPVCGCRQKCRRVYKCRACGYQAPRDVVGSLNILDIGLYQEMKPRTREKVAVKWKHPIKYAGNLPDRPGGIPACEKSHVARAVKRIARNSAH